MSLQNKHSDPNWEYLRMILARVEEPEEPPKHRGFWRTIEIAALAILIICMGVLVRYEVADVPTSAVSYAIEQFEAQITYLGQQVLQAARPRVVHAQSDRSAAGSAGRQSQENSSTISR